MKYLVLKVKDLLRLSKPDDYPMNFPVSHFLDLNSDNLKVLDDTNNVVKKINFK